MFRVRSPLILAAPPAGLVLAALVWFAFDGAGSVMAPLERLSARARAVQPRSAPSTAESFRPLAQTISSPIFALAAGPGAVTDPTVRLDGLAISPKSSSALLSIAGKPAAWTSLGATSEGVTLMDVKADKVVVDTVVGFKEVPLWGGAPTGIRSPSPTPVAALKTPLVGAKTLQRPTTALAPR